MTRPLPPPAEPTVTNFFGAKVPFGFLETFARPGHGHCGGRGLVKLTYSGRELLCYCVGPRASAALVELGADEFRRRAAAWTPDKESDADGHSA